MAQLFRSRKKEAPLELAERLHEPASLPEVIAGRRIQFAQVSQALSELAAPPLFHTTSSTANTELATSTQSNR
jgi:hypothetical protein